MDAQAFWDVIGAYNQSTWPFQIFFLTAIVISILFAYRGKCVWLPKVTLGIMNLFIGGVFFLLYGTEPIQTYFAFPLYIAVGLLFLYEAIKHKQSTFRRFDVLQWVLLCMVIAYPFISMLLGHSFPKLVVYIMPCPVISLSIVVYASYSHKNKILLALMAIWGLTGVKSFIVNALEDVILLICGLYCVYILIRQFRRKEKA